MRDRGKAVAVSHSNNSGNTHHYYSTSSTSTSDPLLCRKHPSSSSVGICAYCLKDRLVKLVCSECGEQRLSSCSCSEISSNRNSCTVEVGSVGRVSFLIENEKAAPDLSLLTPNPNGAPAKAAAGASSELPVEDDEVFLRRSSSTSVDVLQRVSTAGRGGLRRLKHLFGKKKKRCDNSAFDGSDDGRNEVWAVANGRVSRSRSLCSFRREDPGGDEWNLNARSSCGAADRGRRSRDSGKGDAGFDSRRVFSLREGGVGDSGFIDLKLGVSAPRNLSAARSNSYCSFADRGGGRCSFDGAGEGGGACRITVSDRGTGKGRKSTKVWRWIFRGKS